MPTKHIEENTWRLIEQITVKAVIATQKPIKEGKILEFIIKRGLKNIEENEYFELIKK